MMLWHKHSSVRVIDLKGNQVTLERNPKDPSRCHLYINQQLVHFDPPNRFDIPHDFAEQLERAAQYAELNQRTYPLYEDEE